MKRLLALTMLVPLSCDMVASEHIEARWIPLQVLSCSPASGLTTGGESVTVWFAASRFDPGDAVTVTMDGNPATVLNVTGPYSESLFAALVTTPAMARGDIDVRMTCNGEGALAHVFRAVPANLSVTVSEQATGGNGPFRLCAGDFFGSGATCAAVAHNGALDGTRISCVDVSASGTPVLGRWICPAAAKAVASADLSRSGSDELIAACWTGTGVSQIVLFEGGSGFSGPLATASAAPDPVAVHVEGQGSGPISPIILRSSGSSLEVFHLDAAANLTFVQAIPTSTAVSGCAFVDLNQDGRSDLVFSQQSASRIDGACIDHQDRYGSPIPVFSGGAPTVMTGNKWIPSDQYKIGWYNSAQPGISVGKVASGPAIVELNVIPGVPGVQKVILADFDGDGNPDIVSLLAQSIQVDCLDDVGSQIAGRTLGQAYSNPVSDLQVCDLENDGFLDFLLTSPTSNQIVICHNSSN